MLRVGIDLTCSNRFESMHTPGGSAFYKHVFTLQEQQEYGYVPSLLAVCFAAKEAVSKVLGTGLTIGEIDHVTCRSIEISNAAMSEPNVYLNGVALEIAQRSGCDHMVLQHASIGNSEVVYAIGGNGMPVAELQAMLKSMNDALMHQLLHRRNNYSIEPK